MARGFVRTYRTYSYIDKNPVIDKVRTVLQDEGMFTKEKRRLLHELSGVGVGTYDGWFEGETRNPRHETIMATMSSLGYEEQFVKAKEIDIEKERKAAADWLAKQEKRVAVKKAKPKTNGHSTRRKWTGKGWQK